MTSSSTRSVIARTCRQALRSARRSGGALALLLSACTVKDPGGPVGPMVDAAVSTELPPAVLTATPARTPGSTVAIRGTTAGHRIVVQTMPTGSVATVVLPNGSFCVDAPIQPGQAATYRVYALGGDGRVSAPAQVEVQQDDSAAAPVNATCSGQSIVKCVPEECDNSADDDCNGWVDECDTACNGCEDDVLAPNSVPVEAPTVLSRRYTNLALCPCRDDYLAFTVEKDGHIWVSVSFDETELDVDLELLRAEDVEQGGMPEPVASSTGSEGSEEINWFANKAGTYYLKVFAAGPQKSGSYSLTVY